MKKYAEKKARGEKGTESAHPSNRLVTTVTWISGKSRHSFHL